jgi:hypothetical protein
MTISACYLSSEGVVLGADSTTTTFVQGPGPNPVGIDRYYTAGQKVFQIGSESTLGLAMWGLGSLGETSFRTLIARLADDLTARPGSSMSEIADRWNLLFWAAFAAHLGPLLPRAQQLRGQLHRTPVEETELASLEERFSVGFCLGGYCFPDRKPEAFELAFQPSQTGPLPPQSLPIGSVKFWGSPNIMNRLIHGIDLHLLLDIKNSPHWSGTTDDLAALVNPHQLSQPFDLPIREAIDWVYTVVYTTSQAMKFSHLAPVCGGPVEVAVITTDRPFRWVCHKSLDAAISQGRFSHAEAEG